MSNESINFKFDDIPDVCKIIRKGITCSKDVNSFVPVKLLAQVAMLERYHKELSKDVEG